VRVGFRAEIGEIDIAVFQASHRDHFEAGHHGARWVSAVRRSRYEADVAGRLAARGVIFPDGQQSCVFALRTSVWLKRDRGEASDFGEPCAELIAHLAITDRLVLGRERMQLRELRPRNWKHFGGRVQLHRARSEWDHRSRQ
jgi:hypothetical protein